MLEVAAGILLGTMDSGWLLVGCGVCSALLGAYLVEWPNAALHGIVWLISAGATLFGSLLILVGFKIRRLGLEVHEGKFTAL